MKSEPDIRQRRSIRLKGYDYSQPGAYFVTIVAHNRDCLFGRIMNKKMVMSKFGSIVEKEWRKTSKIRKEIELDTFIIMPNHLHGIIVILPSVGATGVGTPLLRLHWSPLPLSGPEPKSLGAIMAGFKSAVTKQINIIRGIQGVSVWQRNYYDRIIRNEDELINIREYISNNPTQWEYDLENPTVQSVPWPGKFDEPWLA